nr:MAG TPA: hypothetical protein [Caudoviricetes sp.]
MLQILELYILMHIGYYISHAPNVLYVCHEHLSFYERL